MSNALLSPDDQQQESEPSKNRFRDTVRQLEPVRQSPTVAPNNPQQDGAPLSPAEQAQLDQIEAGLRNGDTAKEPRTQKKTQQAKKAASFMQKNKKWIFGGATGLGILIPIFMFFFWLMLFKNVHIKNLYVTYRWAQFNRGINKALKEQLEAQKTDPAEKPSGNADTTVEPTDTPEDLSAKTNAQEAGPDNINPDDPAQVEAEGKRLTNIEQSVEGASESALKDAGLSRDVKSAEGEGATPEERAKSAEDKARTNVEEDINKPGELSGDAPETLREGVEEAKNQEGAGETPAKAAEKGATKVIEGGSKLSSAVQKIGKTFVWATFYCIFHDIYSTGKAQINKIALTGAMGVSQEINKTADCQKLGKCDANQVGAVANKMDSDKESFTESCGYSRATQSSNPACKEIDPQYVVDGLADIVKDKSGVAAAGLKTVDFLGDPPKVLGYDLVGDVCSFVMDPKVQIVQAIASVGGIIATGGGWGAVGEAVGDGATVFLASAGGKALIASAILRFSGGAYKNLGPHDMGNLADMGNAVTASASCKAAGCPQASDAEIAKLDNDYRLERIAANSRRSTLEKFFDTSSPDSVASRAILNAPSTPSAMIGRVKIILASISNPLALNHSIGSSTVALTRNDSAYAASDVSVYGLSGKVTVPPNLLPGAPSRATALSWAKGRDLSSLGEKLDPCKESSYSSAVSSDDNTCSWDNMDQESRYYVTYRFYQRVGYNSARAHNKQSNIKGRTGGAISGATTTNAKKGVDTAGQPCPAGTVNAPGFPNGQDTNHAGTKLQLCDIGDGTIVNQSAAAAFYAMKQAAAQDRITLYGGGYRSYQAQIQARITNGCPDIYTASPSLCKVPTARPGESNHEEGLAVDFKHSTSRTTPVFQWLAAHAAEYGIRNLPSEPWHWSVNGG